MKFINEFYHKYYNQSVWIVGADPTLDSYPNNFLDGKLSITLGVAHAKFPEATYRYNNEGSTVKEFKLKDPLYLDRMNIWAWPFYGISKAESAKITGDTGRAIYVRYKPYPPNGHRDDILTNIGFDAMARLVAEARSNKPGPYGCYATCLHTCLYCAIILGCNPINIIACNHKIIKGRFHARVYEDRILTLQETRHSEYHWCRYAEMGTQAIIEGCKIFGITVNRYENYESTRSRN